MAHEHCSCWPKELCHHCERATLVDGQLQPTHDELCTGKVSPISPCPKATDTQPLDITNRFLISTQGETIVMQRSARNLTRAHALALAAWLVALADTSEAHTVFQRYLNAVESS